MSFSSESYLIKSVFTSQFKNENLRVRFHIKPGVTDISSIVFRDEVKIMNRYKDSIGFYNKEIIPLIDFNVPFVFKKNGILLINLLCIFLPKSF